MTSTSLIFAPLDVPTAAQMNRLAEAAQPFASYTPTITNATTSPAASARYMRHGDRVTVEFQFTLNAAPTGAILMSLPVGASLRYGPAVHAVRGTAGSLHSGAAMPGFVYLAGGNDIGIQTPAGATWNATVPVTWASGDVIGGTFSYEAA